MIFQFVIVFGMPQQNQSIGRGLSLNNHKEKPQEKRESGNLTDLAGGLGWKRMGMVIVGIIVGYVLYHLFS